MIREDVIRRCEALSLPAHVGLDPASEATVRELFSPSFVLVHLLTEAYAARTFLGLALDLGWEPRLRSGARVADLLEGFRPPSEAPIHWMLRFLVHQGLLESEGDRYRLRALPDEDLANLRELLATEAPGSLVNVELLDAARRSLRAYFTEGRDGGELLFGIDAFPLWIRYFQNENLLYHANNVLGWIGLRPVLRPGAQILEVGGGVGSFVQTLTPEERQTVGSYLFTDVAQPFLRRAQRVLPELVPGLPLQVQRLDIDVPLDEQGLAGRRFDGIVAINVLHVARDLPRTLVDLRNHLAPGGRLVLAECLKPSLEVPLYLEGCFQFIRAFQTVELDPELRPAHGFLTPEHWVRLLRHAGFTDVWEIPPVRPLMDRVGCFNVGAFAASPPAVPVHPDGRGVIQGA